MDTFGEFLQRNLTERGMRQADLARDTTLTTAAVALLVNNKVQKPQPETCLKIAKAFRLPFAVVLEAAGYPSPGSRYGNTELSELSVIVPELSEDDRRRLLDLARVMASR